MCIRDSSNTDPKHSRWSAYCSIYFTDEDADGRQDSTEVCRVSGKVDAMRLPKELYFAHRVIQNEQPDLHILGHWTYPATQPDGTKTVKTVYVIANTESVELFVNGKSLGVNSVSYTHLDVYKRQVLSGALIDIDQGSSGGPQTAQCTTDASGTCVTPPDLLSGSHYCWAEVVAPPGLAGGANGCFSADNDQADQPITVNDAGEFVDIDVLKVDAANTSVGLPGATFDLYRLSGASLSSTILLPSGPVGSDELLVATTTTGTNGVGKMCIRDRGIPGRCRSAHRSGQARPD